jgi:hypothetical protein
VKIVSVKITTLRRDGVQLFSRPLLWPDTPSSFSSSSDRFGSPASRSRLCTPL